MKNIFLFSFVFGTSPKYVFQTSGPSEDFNPKEVLEKIEAAEKTPQTNDDQKAKEIFAKALENHFENKSDSEQYLFMDSLRDAAEKIEGFESQDLHELLAESHQKKIATLLSGLGGDFSYEKLCNCDNPDEGQDRVKKVQEILFLMGFDLGGFDGNGVDGYYGKIDRDSNSNTYVFSLEGKTPDAVQQLQQFLNLVNEEKNMKEDKKFGENTKRSLEMYFNSLKNSEAKDTSNDIPDALKPETEKSKKISEVNQELSDLIPEEENMNSLFSPGDNIEFGYDEEGNGYLKYEGEVIEGILDCVPQDASPKDIAQAIKNKVKNPIHNSKIMAIKTQKLSKTYQK